MFKPGDKVVTNASSKLAPAGNIVASMRLAQVLGRSNALIHSAIHQLSEGQKRFSMDLNDASEGRFDEIEE